MHCGTRVVLSVQINSSIVASVLACVLGGCAASVPAEHRSVVPNLPADVTSVPGQSVAEPPALNADVEAQTEEPVVEPVAYSESATYSESASEACVEEPTSIATLISESEFVVDLEQTLISASDMDDDGVDLASLESLAEANHPELQQALARVSQARGTASQAALPYNPVLQYQSDEIGNGDVSGLHSVTVMQRFVTANKLGIAQQQQLQRVQQRLAEYEFSRLRVLTRVRSAYAQMQVAQQRIVITQSIADLAKRSVETVNSLLGAGEVSRIALLQSQVEAQRADLAHRNALTTLEQSRRSLAAAVGVGQLPSESVRSDLPEQLPAQPWRELVDEVSSLSPQVTSANAQMQQARWALQLACARVTPDVTGQLGVGYDAGTDDTYATVGVSVPLPIRNRNQGNIRAARAQISASSANIDRTALVLQQAMADAVGRYEVARQTYTQIRGEISPAASEAYELARRAFESGEADFLQVLTAQRTWFDARLAAVNAFQDARTADAEIRGALTTIADSSL